MQPAVGLVSVRVVSRLLLLLLLFLLLLLLWFPFSISGERLWSVSFSGEFGRALDCELEIVLPPRSSKLDRRHRSP